MIWLLHTHWATLSRYLTADTLATQPASRHHPYQKCQFMIRSTRNRKVLYLMDLWSYRLIVFMDLTDPPQPLPNPKWLIIQGTLAFQVQFLSMLNGKMRRGAVWQSTDPNHRQVTTHWQDRFPNNYLTRLWRSKRGSESIVFRHHWTDVLTNRFRAMRWDSRNMIRQRPQLTN